jgi:putative GTP pyrophosphokinase
METDEIVVPDRRELERQYGVQYPRYEAIMGELEGRVKLCLDPLDLHPTIKSRVKSFKSFFKKTIRLMQKAREEKKQPIPITDILGMRIICPFIEDLKRVEEAMKSGFEVTELERKGSNLSFKEFGYESTHLLVKIPHDILSLFPVADDMVFEVQIRTILQDAWAEVEHELVYKAEFTPFDEPMKRKLAALNANLSLSDIIFQEIRDYQRQLNNELMRRRAAFFGKIEASTDKLIYPALPPKRHSSAISPIPPAKPASGAEPPDFRSNMGVGVAVSDPSDGDEATIDDQLLEALYAHNRNDYVEAISIYSAILARDPKPQIQAIIYIHRGMAHFARSAYDEAIGDFTKALEMNPANFKASYYRAVVYSVQEKYARAIEDFNISLDVNPYQYFALYRRGQAYYHVGDYAKALSDCDKALDLEPDSEGAGKFRDMVAERLRM